MKINYNGYLLVASKKLSGGQPWHTIAIYSFPDNKRVKVFTFDCDTVEQIKEILSEQISEIEFNPIPSKQDLKNLGLLRELAERISVGQDIPNKLLYSLKRNFTAVEKEYCIFLPKE